MLAVLVHATAPTSGARSEQPSRSKLPPAAKPAHPRDRGQAGEGLPHLVAEMREAILAAVRSGQIEDLRTAIEMNEIRPSFAYGPGGDPIAHLRALSADGEGRDVLAAIGNVLETGWIALPLGRDIENNRVYIWPRFAETGLAGLTAAEEVDLYRVAPAEEVRRMRAAGRWDGWRIGIGADGVWHFLDRHHGR